MTSASAPMSRGCAVCTISPPPDQANRITAPVQLQDRRAVARLRCADAPTAMRIATTVCQPCGQAAPYRILRLVRPPVGVTRSSTLQPVGGPVMSRVKLPSSSGPESPAVA